MGCGSSAHEDRLQTVDDSVRVMLTNDKKRKMEKGEKLHGYVPRAEHPLFKPIPVQVTEPMDDQWKRPKEAAAVIGGEASKHWYLEKDGLSWEGWTILRRMDYLEKDGLLKKAEPICHEVTTI
jgi:hypothetical protein